MNYNNQYLKIVSNYNNNGKIKKVLVVNRAEIAVRIIKTLKSEKIFSIAIYTDEEIDCPHVKLADQAVNLGNSSLANTYLNIEKILKIAKENEVDAIHPGYGFLSENAEFANRVEKENIIFIGPNAKNILDMGDKIRSKELAAIAKVPLLSSINLDSDFSKIDLSQIKNLGLPLLIKASSGGGGKGMKTVCDFAEFEEQYNFARSEALNYFGDDKLFVEKLIENPRHVEVQIASDQHGNHIFLFERECSIQRRHQKIIEETPSLYIDDKLRLEMKECALKLCKNIDYLGVGTIEFLVKGDSFYFLEMNTRLQVEHPITEMITGIDLVQLQLFIANGGNLKELDPDNICTKGHAIELRIYAEDADNHFLPQVGKMYLDLSAVEKLKNELKSSVRVDFGYSNQNVISANFDPMIGKIIVHSPTRYQCIQDSIAVLEKFYLLGITTNLYFLKEILESDDFKNANTATSFCQTFKKKIDSEETNICQKLSEELLAALSFLSQEKFDIEKKNNLFLSLNMSKWRL